MTLEAQKIITPEVPKSQSPNVNHPRKKNSKIETRKFEIEKLGYCEFRTRPFMTTKTGKTMFPFSYPHRILCTVCIFSVRMSPFFGICLSPPPPEGQEGTRSGTKGRVLAWRVPIAPTPPHPTPPRKIVSFWRCVIVFVFVPSGVAFSYAQICAELRVLKMSCWSPKGIQQYSL